MQTDCLDWKEHHHGHHPEVQSLCQKKKKGKMQRLPAAHLKKKTRVELARSDTGVITNESPRRAPVFGK